jgi:hypothetical protein
MKPISEQHFPTPIGFANVGRTPWSAAGPPAGLFRLPTRWILSPKSVSRGTRADQGVCPTVSPQKAHQ